MHKRIFFHVARLLTQAVPTGVATALILSLSTPVWAEPAGKGQPPTGSADPVAMILQPVNDWLERANREYQDNVVHSLSVPTGVSSTQAVSPPPTPSAAAKPNIVTPGEPTLLGQVKALLGLEPSQPPEPPVMSPQQARERKEREDAVQRQIEARALEQKRNAEQQQLAIEAQKSADLTDAATKQRQKAAEAARIAAEEGRKPAGSPEVAAVAKPAPPAKPNDEIKKEIPKKDDAKKADASTSTADAGRAAEKAAADKKAAAEDARKSREALAATEREQKRKAEAEATAAKRMAQAAKPPETERAPPAGAPAAQPAPAVAPPPEKAPAKRADPSAAGSLADAANKAASKALAKLKAPGKSEAKSASHSTASKSMASAGGRGNGDKSNGGSSRGRCARAGRDVELPAIYVVKSGDTLWDISKRYYDKGHKFEKIVRANEAKISSPDLIFPCQKFYLPARSALYWAIPLADDTDAG